MKPWSLQYKTRFNRHFYFPLYGAVKFPSPSSTNEVKDSRKSKKYSCSENEKNMKRELWEEWEEEF